ncbi:hypothetical protein ABJ73_10255 [Salmonella enterica subsp. enterica serovar Infantis]|uniref:Uncharacterized protein n=1 Tax=Salmonella enterica subsp. enterica serovar Heidelberg TaxID=611 RepID=A0A737S3B4_SALET|nr:hypothetical protein [Salmonella enterica subsp. enterica serovar Oranienburg]ECM8277610.1 hypothetical protein [Salmonella enterica subsp. enterica serovar Infantis]TSD25030.1 hypothetical protein FPB07_04100 [Enterobacter hormaechei]HAE8467376.1 hypothetical protein [Salmonella enterica subsp. enterica serovar Heidelberg]HAH0791134.1 hypothetical protein [Escherichia coli]HAU5698830.1 hypothetical protein [Citrobacter freundii]
MIAISMMLLLSKKGATSPSGYGCPDGFESVEDYSATVITKQVPCPYEGKSGFRDNPNQALV